MKRNLLSGLILLLPLAITIALFVFLVDLLTTPFLGSMEALLQFIGRTFSINLNLQAPYLVFLSRVLILIFLFFFVLILGFLGNRLFFNWLVGTMHLIMGKIPLINTIYKVCKDIIEAVFSGNKKLFSRVVVVPFPSKKSKALGLVTGNAPCQVQDASGSHTPQKLLKSVFVPTSPHPISGFLLLIEAKHLDQTDISIEDAFKFLISCGMFVPEPHRSNAADEDETDDSTSTDLPDME